MIFARLPKWQNFVLFLLSAAAIAVFDYVTEPENSLLYLAPITAAAWYLGKWGGVFFSLLSSALWLYVNLITRFVDTSSYVPYWEMTVRLGFFLTVSLILSRLRRALQVEQRLSRTDGLTRIANVRRFNEALEAEFEKLRRYRHPLTVLYMDVDNFKEVNDRSGHSAGDTLLLLIADTLKRNTRSADMPARLGGDEFAVLLPETGFESAKEAVAKLQNCLRGAVRRREYPVSFSIGAVTFNEAPRSVDEAIRMADRVMYSVKKSGKDRARHELFPGRTAAGNTG